MIFAIESTLFGTVKGAFTDARDRKGLIHLAEHGTIFLDEIGEMPLSCQTKLLHTLDDGCFRKVGRDVEEKSDARFIFATNAKLKELVRFGAPKQIMYLNKPHIGTDNLINIIACISCVIVYMFVSVFVCCFSVCK